jgi:hypothetical protein
MSAYLASEPTPFVSFTLPDLANPGAFHFVDGPRIKPGPTHYGGKVVVLVDETSQSQAEYTAMALRAMPNSVVIGSTTAGADGDVSAIPLPGGLSTMFSGIGVFYPDHRPTQRLGIVPDIVVAPTVQASSAAGTKFLRRPSALSRTGCNLLNKLISNRCSTFWQRSREMEMTEDHREGDKWAGRPSASSCPWATCCRSSASPCAGGTASD